MRERGLDMAVCDQIADLSSAILSASSLRDPNDGRARKLAEVLRYLEQRIDSMLDARPDGAEPAIAAVPPPPSPAEIVPEPLAPEPPADRLPAVEIEFDPMPMNRPPVRDPLAALRAMSDEERIALFT
jgi:hypothetical protein